MCSEVESNGLKAITSLLWQYVLYVCLPGIILHFAQIYRAECSVQRLNPLKLVVYKISGEKKILENKILTQLQTNVSTI